MSATNDRENQLIRSGQRHSSTEVAALPSMSNLTKSSPVALSLEQRFLEAEQHVEQLSASLKKELRLRDLVAIQILWIVGLGWVGTAAKVGPSHLMFWLAAMLLFYIPSGIVVAHLVTEMPLEGGLYQWSKLRFGSLVGFLVAMNIWLNNVFIISAIGVQSVDSISYALGSNGAAFAGNKLAICVLSGLVVCGLMIIAWRGLSFGKWVNAIGSLGVLFLFASIIVVAAPRWVHRQFAFTPVTLAFPAITVFNLNLLGKMGFGAFGGFDGVAIFAGECRDANVAARIRRSVWFSGPVISAMFILGTASVLTFVRPDSVDLVAPITQVLSLGAPQLKTMAAVMLVITLFAGNSLCFSAITRLPMVAGWDHLLPSWFSRLHPRHRSPTGSIVVVGGVSFVFAMLANLSAGNQEAYQLLNNAGVIFYALTYLTMFAIPLVASGEKPNLKVRVAAISGFLMTLLYVTLSVIPIVDVTNRSRFTLNIVAVVVGFQLAGAAYFWRVRKTRRLTPISQ
jgi:amino acid transporter